MDLPVNDIGEFIRYRSCERRFKLQYNKHEIARRVPFYDRLMNPLDLVLQRAGHIREDEWATSLAAAGLVDVIAGRPNDDDEVHPAWLDFVAAVDRTNLTEGSCGFAREVRLAGKLGAFNIRGRADFLLLLWRDGEPVLRVVECKASRRDRTYHRLQVTIYRMLLQQLLREHPLVVDGKSVASSRVEAVVARIDETTNSSQDILELDPLDVEMEEGDAARLLAPGGTLVQILDRDLEELGFSLDTKCDGCVFNVHCLSESSRQRRLELTGCSPSSATVLRERDLRGIDDLADLDCNSDVAEQIRTHPAFADDLDRLAMVARARRTTLPGAVAPADGGDAYPVEQLPNSPQSQLPEHVMGTGASLVRVYLAVDYDYTENRVGALTAHVTASSGQLRTQWTRSDGKVQPDPVPVELLPDNISRAVLGQDVCFVQHDPWTGDYAQDTASERSLVQNFLGDLIAKIGDVAGDPSMAGTDSGEAAIHFYVWSRSELTQLVEACSRASSRLLKALLHLLGCREGVEQLIYSSLQDEVDNRYALGWTGRGLNVVTSLSWYGQRFHWTRKVSGQPVALDWVFRQDLFDFKTDLAVADDGTWARDDSQGSKHKFEIRSRFHDSLPAPYWHALWGTLPDQSEIQSSASELLRRYTDAGRPELVRTYLHTRTHALRWIDERIRFKNPEIVKVPLPLASLSKFDLRVDSTREAAIDFLRLDHAVNLTDWIGAHMRSVRGRLPDGHTLPVTRVRKTSNGRIVADIDASPYGLTVADLARIFSLDGFVRIVPHSGDPAKGQTFKQLTRIGMTCVIRHTNWEANRIEFDVIRGRSGRYVLPSFPPDDEFQYATVESSPTDFVAARADARLSATSGPHVGGWFDREHPEVPPVGLVDHVMVDQVRSAISEAYDTCPPLLNADQVNAVCAGLSSRIQLLQGPPGTGKTQTTSVAILARAAARIGVGGVVLVAAHTHTAIDTLLRRIARVEPEVRELFIRNGIQLPAIRVAKVHTSDIEHSIAPDGDDLKAQACTRDINRLRKDGVAVVGGTTTALLKMITELDQRKPWCDATAGFQTSLLVVDEASMMVFPHFLALATAVDADDGCILLAGDHRQLSPIVANNWEREDRPPAVQYQPYVSAYEAIRRIADVVPEASVTNSALQTTFRLPSVIIDLIGRLYELDDITLQGVAEVLPSVQVEDEERELDAVWTDEGGLFLVVHDERSSRQSNDFEAELISRIAELAPKQDDSRTAVLTPHRAQRRLLKQKLDNAAVVDIVDTVERLQGGERPTVVFSGTASEPSCVARADTFLLDLNRSNVAFSRCQRRLIVVCARTLLDHVPADFDTYQSAMLWKALRTLCTRQVGIATIDGITARVLTVALKPPPG